MTEHSGFAVASELGIAIASGNDVADALTACMQYGGLVLAESELCAEFFDLRSGLAGEVLQKFVNYQARVAIVVENPASYGERFGELAYEHESHPFVRFFSTDEKARAWLRG